jgi:glycine C-acetyltransferase
MVAAAGIRMVDMMTETNELQDKLHRNSEYFIEAIQKLGFDIKPTKSAICAVMLYDARLSQEFAAKLLNEGIYVIGFYYPVVPKGQARIRVQLSAGHEMAHLDKAIGAFKKIGRELGVINKV